MADGIVVVQPDSTGKKIDTSEITVGANTVERQRIVIADPTTAAALGIVMNSLPAGTEYGLVIREAQKGQSTMANSRPVVIASDNVVTVQGSQPSRTTGTITTATSVIGPLTISNLNVITITISGTYAGVTFVFEASDDGGTTWYSVQGQRTDTGFIQTGDTPPSNTSRSWDVSVGGFNSFRVRATAWSSGTANIGLSPQTFAYDPTPSIRNILDGNRTYISIYLDRVTGVTTEALATMNINKAGTVTTGTTYTVTTGKTLRITSFLLEVRTASAGSQVSGRARIRSAATVSATSGIIAALEAFGNGTGTENGGSVQQGFPDGIEIAAAQQIGISQIMSSSSATLSCLLTGFEY